MNFDINTIADICHPHNEKLIAEGKAEKLRAALVELLADIDDVMDGKLPEISAATLTRARQAA